jgi:catechol 2,3-dioxygenase-like lactoylglutathione lyase family enzyme
MFRTLVLGSNDIARSKAFYNATMGILGCPPAEPNWRSALAYRKGGSALLITQPLDGKPATSANGLTVNLEMESEDQVRAWHAAGLAHGGTAIEDPPGIRNYPSGNRLYSAYLRDPDGHKFCASYMLPA